MREYRDIEFGEFEDDQGTVHRMVPSSVVAAVPASKEAAERYGREVNFDFLDDRAVHWLLFQRRQDTATGTVLGCLFSLPLSVLAVGAWPFWDLVAQEKPQAFRLAFIFGASLLFVALSFGAYWARRRSLLDKTNRNMRCRVRLYRRIVVMARKGGANIPRMYPYYGMYATSRKFFPEAPDRPIPTED